MKLNNINNTGSWGDAAAALNNNSAKLEVEITKLKESTTKFCGNWASSTELIANITTADLGSTAYVGFEAPFAVWTYGADGWVDTEATYSPTVSFRTHNVGISHTDGAIIVSLSSDSVITDAKMVNGEIILVETL